MIGVNELKKLPGERCKHASPGFGCKIYGKHPQSCQSYKCLWRLGHLEEEDKPNKRRLIFDHMACPYLVGTTQLNIWETKRGHLQLNAKYVKDLTYAHLRMGVWVMHHPLKGPRLFYIPPGISTDIAMRVRRDGPLNNTRVYYCRWPAP